VEINPRGLILGFAPIPNGDAATTNFAFGGPDNQYIYFEGAISGTFWRFKAPYPGLIAPEVFACRPNHEMWSTCGVQFGEACRNGQALRLLTIRPGHQPARQAVQAADVRYYVASLAVCLLRRRRSVRRDHRDGRKTDFGVAKHPVRYPPSAAERVGRRDVPSRAKKGAFQQQRGTRWALRTSQRWCGEACATWMALCTGSALALPPVDRPGTQSVALTLSAIWQARTAASGSCAPKQVPPAGVR
jgi:hypothetical protein